MPAVVSIFITVFLAELGDKTQLATMLFASDRAMSPWMVFLAAAGALVLSAAVAVFLGQMLGRHLEAIPLKLIAGGAFILIGLWNVWEHWQGAN